MALMTHLAEDHRNIILTARQQEYERLALRYAGLVSRCGRVGALVVERLEMCRAQQGCLTAGPSPG
jgi:hypothetical protein